MTETNTASSDKGVENETVLTTEDETAGAAENAEDDSAEGNVSRLEKLARIFASLAVGASALVAVYQYVESGDAKRREQSVQMLTSWQESEHPEAFARLATAIEKTIELDGSIPRELDGEALMLATKGLGQSVIHKLQTGQFQYQGNWENDIDGLIGFYSEVHFCIDANLCEVEVLRAYFGSGLAGFWSYFSSYADRRRAEFYPQYGRSVDALIEKFGSLK